jgi:membrane-bound lytic murein transglycosylase B
MPWRGYYLALLLALGALAPARADFLRHPEAQQAMAQWQAQLGLPLALAERGLRQAKHNPKARGLMGPAPQGHVGNWQAYRQRFVEPVRIRAGVNTWKRWRTALRRAEQQYGVPANVIIGVLGVETLYGRHMGQFVTLDVLATLAFDFPREHPRWQARQAYFREQLGHFLLLAQETGLSAGRWRGSYAGALGMPQFMPGSWRQYAVDHSGDGRIGLRSNPADAIGSVAHFLREHGWESGVPAIFPVELPSKDNQSWEHMLAPDILPTFTSGELQAAGLRLGEAASRHTGLLALIKVNNGPGNEPAYVLGTKNFYVLTRYNASSYYARAVIDLGEAVQNAKGK